MSKTITTTDKANNLLNREWAKKDLAEELGISRPTLDTRLANDSVWKKLESKWINKLHDELK